MGNQAYCLWRKELEHHRAADGSVGFRGDVLPAPDSATCPGCGENPRTSSWKVEVIPAFDAGLTPLPRGIPASASASSLEDARVRVRYVHACV